MAETIIEALERRFENEIQNKDLLLAAVSHLCFKLDWLETDQEKESATLLLKQNIRMLIEKQGKDNSNNIFETTMVNINDNTTEKPTTHQFFSWTQKHIKIKLLI